MNTPTAGKKDVYSLLLHETGHTVGLVDMLEGPYTSSVMWGRLDDCASKRTLTQDDINGVKDLYNLG